MGRIDDAVSRILAVKHALGLLGDGAAHPPSLDVIGCREHRDLAREAAAASAVLLKHEGGLPLAGGRILVAGAGSDDVGLQCGGWTVQWQGGSGPITPGTSILEALRNALPDAEIVHDADGRFGQNGSVGVAVVAEPPYAEGLGDRGDLRLSEEGVAVVERLRDRVDRLVLVVLSGRPLVLGSIEERCDAIVAAWLPGTEGAGLADVLTGRRPFTGRLPRRWPASQDQVEDPAGAWAPRWDRGHGLAL